MFAVLFLFSQIGDAFFSRLRIAMPSSEIPGVRCSAYKQR
jgi:hypothetical protein